MVKLTYERTKIRNSPEVLKEQVTKVIESVKKIDGVYSVVLVNPNENSDHQYLVVLDDENVDAITKVSQIKFSDCEIKTSPWTHFWIHLNEKNEVVQNYLRTGSIVFDRGYLRPIQELLFQGKIKPSKEAVWGEMVASQEAMKRANAHIKQAVVDLYWCMVDCAHALLAALGEVAPSPKEMKKMLDEKVVPRNLLSLKQTQDFQEVFEMAKKIDHGEVFELSGRDYKELERKAEHFLHDVKKLVKEVSKIP